MNKRGQFFLMAAIIIVIILLGLKYVYNSVKTSKEDTSVYDLSKELTYESLKVLDRGVLDSQNPSQVNSNLVSLSTVYASTYPDRELFIIYGTKSNLTLFKYQNENKGSVSIDFGGSSSSDQQTIVKTLGESTINYTNGKIKIVINGAYYDFDVKDGQNLYMIISKNKSDERIIAQG